MTIGSRNILTTITGNERFLVLDANGNPATMNGSQLATFLAISPKAGPAPVWGGRIRVLTGGEMFQCIDDDGLPSAMSAAEFTTFSAITPKTPPALAGRAQLTTITGFERFLAFDANGFPVTLSGVDVANFAVPNPVDNTPTAPTNVVLSSGISQITITWTDGDPKAGTVTGNGLYLNDGTGEVYIGNILTGSPYTYAAVNGRPYTARITMITDIGGEGPKSAYSNTVTPAATPGPATADITMYVGTRTRVGHGGVSLSSTTLGLLTSGSVAAWNLVRTSGDSAVWGDNLNDGETPKPLRTLTPTDASTTATWQIWADGVNTGKVLAINVEGVGVADGYTVSKPAEIDSSTTGLRATAVKSALGGRRVLFQRGSESKWNQPGSTDSSGQIASFRGFNTHTGVVSLESSDAAHPTKIGRMYIIGGKGITIDGSVAAPLIFARSMTAYPASGLGGNHSNSQNIAMLHLSYSPSFTVTDVVNGVSTPGLANSNIIIKNLTFQHDNINNSNDTTTWVTGLVVNGNTAGSTAGQSANITVQNNSISRVKDGMRVGELVYSAYTGNVVDRFCSNALFCNASNISNVSITDGIHKRPFYNAADPSDHQDFCQIGGTGVRANYNAITIARMKFYTLDGDSSGQGNFWDDYDKSTSATSGTLLNGGAYWTGFIATNCTITNIVYEGPYLNGLTLGFGTGFDVSKVTLIRGKHPNLVLRTPNSNRQKVLDPSFNFPVMQEAVSGTQHGPVGTLVQSAGHGIFNGGNGSPWMVNTNVVLFGNFPLTTPGGSNMQTNDSTSNPATIADIEAYRQSFYSTWFQMNGSGDPEIEARPKVGGPLDLGGGNWVGALKSDGSWA